MLTEERKQELRQQLRQMREQKKVAPPEVPQISEERMQEMRRIHKEFMDSRNPSRKEAAFTGAAQGATIGAADELGAALGAAGPAAVQSSPMPVKSFLYGSLAPVSRAMVRDKQAFDDTYLGGREPEGFGDWMQVGRKYAQMQEGRGFDDYYTESHQKLNQRIEELKDAHPNTYAAGEIAGAVGTGFAAGPRLAAMAGRGLAGAGQAAKAIPGATQASQAATRAGQAIAGAGRPGAAAALAGRGATKIGKGSALGAGAAGLYGYNTGEGEGRAEQARQQATAGAVFGGALPIASKVGRSISELAGNLKRGVSSRSAEELNELKGLLGKAKNELYAQVDASTGVLKPEYVNRKLGGISLENVNVKNSKIKELLKEVENLKEYAEEGNLTFALLDDVEQSIMDFTGRGVNRLKFRVQDALEDMRSTITSRDVTGDAIKARDALMQAKPAYKRYKQIEQIADVIERTDGNPAALKKAIVNLPKLARNKKTFSKDDIEALKKSAEMGPTELLLRAAGKFGIDLGSPVYSGRTVAGTAGAGGLTVAGVDPLVSAGLLSGATGARIADKAIARGKVEKLLDNLEAGAPLGTEIKKLNPKDRNMFMREYNRIKNTLVGPENRARNARMAYAPLSDEDE